MRVEQLGCFVDPESGTALHLKDYFLKSDHVETGILVDASGKIKFEIRNFIPRFVENHNYTENFSLQWQRHAKTQLDSYNGSSYSADRLYKTTGWPRQMLGERILEAGSGAGRFTEILAQTGAQIYTFDYSNAIQINYDNNGRFENVCFFQGDIYGIPFPKGFFDRVLCLGVLQHTPDVHRSFMDLAAMVRPGGYLAVDIYGRVWRQMLHWKYLLRPVTTRIPPDLLYKFVKWYVPKLMPVAKTMRKIGGKAGHRLVPILDQSDKTVSPDVQRDWTILDTYDALSAAYDQPQTDRTVQAWFVECGFTDVNFTNSCGGGRKASAPGEDLRLR